MLNLLLGLIVGALAGLGAGLLKDALDTRIGGAEDVALVGEQPVLGAVPYDPEARTSPLTDPADPFGSRAEAFRKLRTNLAFLRIDGPPRSIAVTSPLQGDGKSSTALNLAFSLADSGYRVALVDADLRRPSIATTLGLVGEAGLTSVLIGRAALGEVLQTATRGSQIQVLTSGPLAPNPSELLATVQFRQVLAGLKGLADYVIVDAATIEPSATGSSGAAAVDGAILVVRARRTRREDLRRALEALTGVDSRVVGIVLNMVARRKTAGYSGYTGGQHQRAEELERV
jgi:capsular exopolysaccharide synthesis family protein